MRFFRFFFVGWWGATAGSLLPGMNTTNATLIQPSKYGATEIP